MRVTLVSIVLCLITYANALHFYLDANQKRCFIEELPSDTVVEGHYKALEWSQEQKRYTENPELSIIVEVTEQPSGHVVVKTNGPLDGKFTFTSHESGDHAICLSTNYASWFSHTHIRMSISIAVGTTRPDNEKDRSHISELASKVRDLNIKMQDVRREQQYQRERERDFRDASETTNTRAVWYSLAQIAVLIMTCAWQMKHLKDFFQDRKAR